MSGYKTLFQDHHAIEQQTLKNSELLYRLEKSGRFDIHAPENRIFLPASPDFASKLGVTPHSGGPLAAYQEGVLDRLDRIEVSRDWQAAMEGDAAATDRVIKRVEQLRDTLKAGLINGDLNTNTPVGQTPFETTQRVNAFFKNSPSYFHQYQADIESWKNYSKIDHGWVAIVGSESRVVATLDQHAAVGIPFSKGGNLVLQKHGLSLAISNAQEIHRLTISESGIQSVERTLGEEAGYRLRVPRSQQGFATMDMLLGEASVSRLARVGGLAGTGADAIITARRAGELLGEGNAAAAQSEFNHAVARNGGGWLGGAGMAALVGTSGFAPVTLVALDALFVAKSFEHGADLLDNRAVFHQKDKAGVAWEFNGRNWVRDGELERRTDGIGDPVEQKIGASYEKACELNAKASAKAVELALGKVPAPQNPFSLPAKAGDQHGLDNPNWHREPNSEQWVRVVKTGVTGVNDRAVYTSEVASPERARELNQEALGRIESNIANGREAVAAAYIQDHAALRSGRFVPQYPEAVLMARAQPDAVRGSDNNLYYRDASGVWSHEGALAAGNLALELELTRSLRQPVMEQDQQMLAQLQALPPPTAAQENQNEILHRYQSYDVRVPQEWLPAIELATTRTLQAHGISGPTVGEPQRSELGLLDFRAGMIHYQTGADGIARQVAVTTPADLQKAYQDLQGAQQERPIQNAPELSIKALTPQQAEAHEQALREANRQGLSIEQAGQVAMLAAVQVNVREVGAHTDAIQVSEAFSHAGCGATAHPEPSLPAPTLPVVEPRPAWLNNPDPRDNAQDQLQQRESDDARAEEAHAQQEAAAVQHAPSEREPVAGRQVEPSAPAPSEIPDPSGRGEPSPESAPAPNLHPSEAATPQAAAPVSALPEARTPDAVPPAIVPDATDSVSNDDHPMLLASQLPIFEAAEHQIQPTAQPMHGADEVQAAPAAPAPVAAEPAETTAPAEPAAPARLEPSDPQHPAHPLYRQVREQVEKLDESLGRGYDDTSERLTESLMVLAKERGLERVDHVVLSNPVGDKGAGYYVFVVQGELDNPAHRRAAMPTAEAVRTPHEETLERLDLLLERDAQQEQQATLQRQQDMERINEEHVRTMVMGDGGGGGGG